MTTVGSNVARFRIGLPGKTIAVIGPDGAGKSSLIDTLEAELPYPHKRIYMGINPDAATHALPTTRLVWFIKRRLGRPMTHGRPETSQAAQKPARPQPLHKRLLRELKSALFVINRISEQWYRQAVCWFYQMRGNVVLIDRHFYLDYLAAKHSAPGGRDVLAWRIHDFLIERVYPRPHLTLYLDAPAEVLYARKQETSLGHLEHMRDAYRQIQNHVPRFEALDATQSSRQVADAARQKIAALLE